MEFMWKDDLQIGIDNIDNQHKELFNRANNLLIAMKDGKGKEEVIKTLDFLEEYIIEHFNDEEALQREIKYPDYNLHHIQHEQLKNEIKEFRIIVKSAGISMLFVIAFQQRLISWCVNHIMESDREIGGFLKKFKDEN